MNALLVERDYNREVTEKVYTHVSQDQGKAVQKTFLLSIHPGGVSKGSRNSEMNL